MTDTDTGATAPLDDAALFDTLASGQDIPVTEPISTPEPAAEPVSATEPDPAAQAAAPDQAPADSDAMSAQAGQQGQSGILAELIAERKKRQAYERQVAEREGELNALRRMMPSAPQQKTPEPPDPFQDPAAFARAAIAPELEAIQRTMIGMARQNAEISYTREAVTSAQAEFDGLIAQGQMDPITYQRVMSAPNPFGAAVEWHRERQIIRDVGTDPQAYRARILDEALKDPSYLARALEAAKASAQPVVTTMPTGRPAASLPSVNRLGSAAPVSAGQVEAVDDDTLWNEVMAPRKKRG